MCQKCALYWINTIDHWYKSLFFVKITKNLKLSLETQSYHVHRIADALKAFNSFIQVTLRNISRCQWSSFHTSPSYTRYLTDCLPLIDPFSVPPLSFSSSVLSDCNYLIIPAFVTHWPRLASSRPLCPSSPLCPRIILTPHVDAPWRFGGHSSSQDSWGPSGAITGLMIGGPSLSSLCFPRYTETDPVIRPRRKGLCRGEKGH